MSSPGAIGPKVQLAGLGPQVETERPAAPAPVAVENQMVATIFFSFGIQFGLLAINEVELNRLRAELFILLEELGSLNRMIARESSADSIRELQEQAVGTRTRICEKIDVIKLRDTRTTELRTSFETQLATADAPVLEYVARLRTLSIEALEEELGSLAKQMPPFVISSINELMQHGLQQQDPIAAHALAETLLARGKEFLNPGPGSQVEPEVAVERPAAPAPVAKKANAVILFSLGFAFAHIRKNEIELAREKDADKLASLAAETAELQAHIETELPKAPLEIQKRFATLQTLSNEEFADELNKLFEQTL